MKLRALALASLTFLALTVHADDESPPAHAPRLSHDLSATTNMLESGHCTAGLQAVGCGVNDRLMLVTSPWLLVDYNMANLIARVTVKELPNHDRYSLQAAYYKTWKIKEPSDPMAWHGYQMESAWLMGLRSFHLSSRDVLHLNVHAAYYKDDTRPFSLRRPIPGRSPWQFNLTALNEVDLVGHWFAFFEVGAVEITQPIFYLHYGSSIGYSRETWAFHVGLSVTATPTAFYSPQDRRDFGEEESRVAYTQKLSRQDAQHDYAMHQEFSLQYFF